MWELKPGVFVANINARVRDLLWKKIEQDWMLDGILLHNAQNEQGYEIRSCGNPGREILHWEGLYLVAKKARKPRESKKKAKEEVIEWNY